MLTFQLPGPYGLNILEVWFPRTGDALRMPGRCPKLMRLFHLERRARGLLGYWERRQTLVTDLSTIDDLNARLSSSLRYQIRRARDRDGMTLVDDWTPEQVVAFADEHNPENPNRPSLKRMKALRALGRLLIRAAVVDGKPLCVHTIIHNERIARGLNTYTARHADKANAAVVGRATKASDFETLFHLRKLGMEVYDWGGYTGKPGNGIDAYKRQFLGELRRSWCFHGVNLPTASTIVF